MKVRIPWKPNKAQKQMMREEIDKYLIAADNEHHLDTEALILWALHKFPKTRFGKRRLKEFYTTYDKIHQEMLQHYEMRTNDDAIWLAHYKLKEIGVDVKEWHEEAVRLRKGK